MIIFTMTSKSHIKLACFNVDEEMFTNINYILDIVLQQCDKLTKVLNFVIQIMMLNGNIAFYITRLEGYSKIKSSKLAIKSLTPREFALLGNAPNIINHIKK